MKNMKESGGGRLPKQRLQERLKNTESDKKQRSMLKN